VVLFFCSFYASFVNMNISVAIVEDNNDIRTALEQIIEMADGYDFVGSCVSGEEAVIKLTGIKLAEVDAQQRIKLREVPEQLAGGRAAAGMVATRTGVRPHAVALSQPPPPTTSREPAPS